MSADMSVAFQTIEQVLGEARKFSVWSLGQRLGNNEIACSQMVYRTRRVAY